MKSFHFDDSKTCWVSPCTYFEFLRQNVSKLRSLQRCKMRLFNQLFKLKKMNLLFRKYLGKGKGWTLSFIWSRSSNGLCKQMDFYYPCCQYFHVNFSLCSLKTIENSINYGLDLWRNPLQSGYNFAVQVPFYFLAFQQSCDN